MRLNIGRIMNTEIYELMIYLAIDIIVYIILLTLVNSSFGKRLWNNIIIRIFGKNVKYEITDDMDVDELVENEKRIVRELAKTSANSNDKFVVEGLKKNFFYRFTKFSAVKDLHFVITNGQCFGLVGINGAGKSVACKILAGDLVATDGNTFLRGISMKEDLRKYMSLIGYCPQTNALYDELTAREMLTLLATLRGFKEPDKQVDEWISILGVEHYQDRYIDTYSSGDKRKLCIGLSMIGQPSAIFLDEPTAGIDPSSRRRIYRAIKLAKRSNRIVVFASHNLKECEDLCDRVSVIHGGILKRIGILSELKKLYASGYTLIVKLYTSNDYDKQTDLLIVDIIAEFGESCQMKDKRLGLFHFVVTDKAILWSHLFSGMEKLKKKHFIVDDYIISNSTVDEVIVPTALKQPTMSL